MLTVPAEVVSHYSRRNALTEAEAEARFRSLESFLDQAVFGPLVPSKDVDSAWHEFILHTRLYEAYCIQRYGLFIHHTPHTPTASESADCGSGDDLGPLSDSTVAVSDCSSDCSSS